MTQIIGLRAAKQALALFNFHHQQQQQQQQQKEILMVQWSVVDACDVSAGALSPASAALPASLHLTASSSLDDACFCAGVAILCHLAYFSLLSGHTAVIRSVHARSLHVE